jgi:hypothetical protein
METAHVAVAIQTTRLRLWLLFGGHGVIASRHYAALHSGFYCNS